MPAPKKAKKSGAFPALDGMFHLTPDQHRTLAKDLRRQVNDPNERRHLFVEVLLYRHRQLFVGGRHVFT